MDYATPRTTTLEVGDERVSWLRRSLRALGIAGENPALTSRVNPLALDAMRVTIGLVVLYDAWAALTWPHKTQMAHFLGVGMDSAWVALVVAAISFVELTIAVSILAGRGIQVMGWIGVIYGLAVWIFMEHGGDFGQDATDPGVGLPYAIMFLFVIGADRLRREKDASHNEILAFARVAFGLLWGYDAILKFQPYFLNHYLDYLTGAQKDVGAATWQGIYDQAWIAFSNALGAKFVAFLVGVAEAALAIGLIAGRGLRVLGPIGIALSLVIWTTAEEWGGPYSAGASTMMPMVLLGTAIIYALTFGYVWLLYNPLELIGGRKSPR